MADRHESSGLTRRRSWHGPASARRPSRLGTSKPLGVTRRAFARLTCSAPRAALASARGPWPCSLASDPLGAPEKEAAFAASVVCGQWPRFWDVVSEGPRDRVGADRRLGKPP